MEASAALHPSAEVLRALALGKLDDSSASAVLSHLDGCNDCRKEVVAVTNDNFLNRLRQAHERSGTPPPAKSLAVAVTVKRSNISYGPRLSTLRRSVFA